MCYNWNCYNNTRGAFLFIEPVRETHKNIYGQSPRNLGKPRYCCSKRTGSLSCGDFAIMTKGNGLPCKQCGTSEWYDSGNCKQCAYEAGARWRRENPERSNESSRNWKRNNPTKRAAQRRNWKKNNPEKWAAKMRGWRRRNPEKAREIDRRWKESNPEKVAASNQVRRTRETEAGGSYTPEEFKALCDQYDNRCLCCGEKKLLEFDHVIPVVKGGNSDILNGQPLCRSCNSRKGTRTTDYRTKPGLKRWKQDRLL